MLNSVDSIKLIDHLSIQSQSVVHHRQLFTQLTRSLLSSDFLWNVLAILSVATLSRHGGMHAGLESAFGSSGSLVY